MRAQLQYHVYVNISSFWAFSNTIQVDELKVIGIYLEQAQLASWFYWGHWCQQIFVESQKYGVYQWFSVADLGGGKGGANAPPFGG